MEHERKIWEASGYDQTNGMQYRDAKEMIDEIVKENLEELEVILDIGCGSGNATKMLSSYVSHKKLYACDFDGKMIDYANENHNDGTIEYFVQDIGLPWEKLDQRLQNLEGKVDLVWSNRCLHWVKDKATAVKTIGRLLKPGGRCYVNTTLTRDLNELEPEEDKQENLKYIEFQSHQEQLDEWTGLFNNIGLKTVNIEMFEKDWLFDSEEQYAKLEGISHGPWIQRLIRENVSEAKKDEIVKKFIPHSVNMLGTKYGENFHNKKSFEMKQIYYEQLRIIGTK